MIEQRRVLSLPTTARRLEKPAHLQIGVKLSSIHDEEREEKEPRYVGYHDKDLEKKRQVALDVLGDWYKHHPQTKYRDRSEHFLTIYFREMVCKRPTMTIISGTVMLGVDLKKLILEVIKDDQRVYVGDIKLLGVEQKQA
jgi:hypothetical protein